MYLSEKMTEKQVTFFIIISEDQEHSLSLNNVCLCLMNVYNFNNIPLGFLHA